MKKILPLFSYIFHPIFIPVFACIIYLFYNQTYFTIQEKLFVVLQIIILTVFIPVLFYFLLRSAGKIDSIMIAEISQRKIPLVLQCFLIILLVRKSITVDRYPELHFFFLSGLLSTLCALALLFTRVKASLHMLTISALTMFVIGLSVHYQTHGIYLISFLVLMNGFVASSRLEMKAHTFKELIIGFFIGAIPQLLLFRFWL